MDLEFEWDPAKAAANPGKHEGVTFEEAMTAFGDPLGGVVDDPAHSLGEVRLVLLAESSRGRVLAVMFTERGPERVRLISARPATRPERRSYEAGFR
ncbi:MAG TPA: BrnT family toxin [Gemmatirosa sp.]